MRTLEDFRRIPLLLRRTYQVRFASFAAQRLPAETVAANERQTSGSPGAPPTVLQTNLVHLWSCAIFMRDVESCGIDTTGTLDPWEEIPVHSQDTS
jgi:hypothetical protein